MKICPKCNQTYDDENLNFCLNDGELLMETESVDAPPTIMMDAPRQTNQDWNNFDAGFGGQNQTNQQNQQIYQQPFAVPQTMMQTAGQDQTLPIIALVAGIASLIMVCCNLGVLFGPVGLIVGYIGMNNANQNPETYGGKNLAIIGMVLGGIGFAVSFLFLVLMFLGNL